MTALDVAPAAARPQVSFGRLVAGLVRSLRAGHARRRANRARHVALLTLLEMDAHRLDDLGIEPQDVLGARGRGERRVSRPRSPWP